MTSNGKSSGNERGTRYGNGAYIGLIVQVFRTTNEMGSPLQPPGSKPTSTISCKEACEGCLGFKTAYEP